MLLRFIARRLIFTVPVLLVAIFITYGLAIYGPGDPIQTLVGETELAGNQQVTDRLRRQHGYDRPFVIQYADYTKDFFMGEWGTSIQLQHQSVRQLVANTLPVSIQLGLVSSVILIGVGVPLGILAAVKRNTWVDYLSVSLSTFGNAIPAFVLAPVLLVVFVLKLDLISSSVGWDGMFSQKVVLPAVTLALGPMVLIVRQTRLAVGDVLQEDYIRTARAKGLRNHTIVWAHVLRNAMQPVVTITGIIVANMLTGSIFVEQIFGIPGFGQLVYNALRQNDLPVLLATTILGAAIVLASNLIVDVSYAIFDPRIRNL